MREIYNVTYSDFETADNLGLEIEEVHNCCIRLRRVTDKRFIAAGSILTVREALKIYELGFNSGQISVLKNVKTLRLESSWTPIPDTQENS